MIILTKQRVLSAVRSAVADLVPTDYVPNPKTRYTRSTGNTAFNGIKITANKSKITVYVDEKIVPYMPYTNEPWLSPRWHGAKNPNEGWWDRFAQELINRVANNLRGEVK